jgi:hypothetical protein
VSETRDRARLSGGPFDGATVDVGRLEFFGRNPRRYYVPIDHAESAVYRDASPGVLEFVSIVSDE